MKKENVMVSNFFITLQYLEKLNSNCINPIMTKQEFNEQKENLNEMTDLFGEYTQLLSEFESLDKNNISVVNKWLAELHRVLTTIEWHVSEVSDINMQIFKNYSSYVKKKL